MRSWIQFVLTLSVLAAQLVADESEDARLAEFERTQASQAMRESTEEKSGRPKIDAKTIINESNGFLREREPEMTSEEYALYEKVVVMLETNPKFALRLLDGMMADKQQPSPAFEFILGNTYYSAGDIEKAERYYRGALTRFPTFRRAWNNLGVLYYTENRFAEAMTCFSRSIALGDKEPMTLGLLGYCLERTRDVISAETAYMQALAGEPANSAWKEGLLRIYIDGGQPARAEFLVRRLINDRPGEARLWLVYAHLLVKGGRKLQAMALLEAAKEAGISGEEEMLLLGDLYAEHQLVPEAIAIYQALHKPDGALGERRLLALAQSLIASRKYADATNVLGMLPHTLSTESAASAATLRAELDAAQKRWPEARKGWQALIALAPMNGKAWIGMGTAYAAEGELERAALAFETALSDPTTSYRAHLELANLELRNRQYAKAASHLEKALAIENTDAVRDYLTQIRNLIPPNSSSSS